MSASPWNILAVIEPDEALSLGLAAVLFGFLAWGLYAFTTDELGRGFHLWPSSGKEWIGYFGRSVLLLYVACALTCRLPGQRWFGFELWMNRGDLASIPFWMLLVSMPLYSAKQRGPLIVLALGFALWAFLFPSI